MFQIHLENSLYFTLQLHFIVCFSQTYKQNTVQGLGKQTEFGSHQYLFYTKKLPQADLMNPKDPEIKSISVLDLSFGFQGLLWLLRFLSF